MLSRTQLGSSAAHRRWWSRSYAGPRSPCRPAKSRIQPVWEVFLCQLLGAGSDGGPARLSSVREAIEVHESRTLGPGQLADYQERFENSRRLRTFVHALEELSLSIVAADLRTPRLR